jgi:hypothetical protein
MNWYRGAGGLLLALMVGACSGRPGVAPVATPLALPRVFPAANAIAGWTPAGEARVYNRDNLYDMVDGQADGFFVYGFEQVAAQRYQDTAGATLEVDIWQVATPADAYGLFTAGLAGQPASICPSTGSAGCYEGDADPGRRLAFWQDRYYVQVYGRQPVPDADLQAFARAVSAALPAGAERPVLTSRLPKDGLVERGFVFFHEEISIQTQVWLGGQNMLGLSPHTNGILARYDTNGGMAYLLLIEYPEAKAASNGLAALKAGQVEGLVAADVRDNLLGAVFGQVDETAADELLAKAWGNQ